MKTDLECLPCILTQAFNTVRLATEREDLRRKVLDLVAAEIPKTNPDFTPAENSMSLYRIVSEVTGVEDPFRELKEQTNREALRMLPRLRKRLATAKNPLDEALHLAVAGNVIDLGIGHAFDLEQDITRLADTPFALDDSASFTRELHPGKKLLYLGDNAGEIVFDRLLVEELLKRGMDITFTVKSSPIINDATRVDAETAGLTGLVPILETGAGDIGVNLGRSNAEFRRAFDGADVILGKGHGNFETLTGRPENLYFLLKAKCAVVARELGVKRGDIVFTRGKVQTPN